VPDGHRATSFIYRKHFSRTLPARFMLGSETMTVAIDDLRRVPLFQGMTDRAITALAELAEEVEFPDGVPIVREGDDGDAFYLLLDGGAMLSQGGRVIRQLAPREFFGEISLVDGRPRTATVITTTAVRAVAIRRDAFLQLMERFPALRLSILMALADRIRADEQNAS
jgi:CRP-like cAMP-binding protein